MTHSGGKPHENVGDRGQRYEVRATGWPQARESVIGWAWNLHGAERLASAAHKAPGCTSTEIIDRKEHKSVITRYGGVLR